jgi:hypothetical protein
MSKIVIGITTSITAAAKTAISSATTNTILGEGPILYAMLYSMLSQAVYITCFSVSLDTVWRQSTGFSNKNE